MGFVITYQERLERLAMTQVALKQSDGQTYSLLVPAVYKVIMEEDGLNEIRAKCFDFMIDLIHRGIAEGKDMHKARECVVKFTCGRAE